ncbi:hypothetical protein [Amycolatopsis sp. Hca4]|nr:hypothetical protein [Amycolatopsis sp. Hca4]
MTVNSMKILRKLQSRSFGPSEQIKGLPWLMVVSLAALRELRVT